jgi:formylglycine-generating enzyme required for sulfatase activity
MKILNNLISRKLIETKLMRKRIAAILLFSAFIVYNSWANNLSISNVSYNNATYQVTFDLSWENSWRRDASIPFNYDGIWIFVKVRECKQKNLGNPSGYYHAWMSNIVSDHSATNSAPGGEPLTIEVGTTDIAAVPRGMGVFVYRASDGGTGTISTTITLQWDKATQAGAMAEIDLADDFDVKVFGVEMVYIPQASYYIGDGGSYNCFHDLSGGTSTPFHVTSENTIYASGTYNRALDASTGTAINASFPKGYGAFWIMKYEISQSQYAEFLNTLTYQQVENRTADEIFTINSKNYVMSNNGGVVNRQSICFIPTGDRRRDKFGVDFNENDIIDETDDGGGIACNYISLRDIMAYLDWAALRPLTELEFEKTCRGTLTPVLNENAWGNGSELEVSAIINSGLPTETASNSGVGLCNFNGTVGSDPMRCGYAATNSTNRTRAGAAYYGVMDMSGNVHEPYVSFYANPAYSNDFDGSTGDGELDADGFQDVSGWPSQAGDADIEHFLAKGGNNNRGEAHLRVSDRRLDGGTNYRYDSQAYVINRNQFCGGRGGR